jgi:acetylornithine deacetylase
MMIEPSGVIAPERLQKLLRQMIDIYSPSGKEVELLEFLQRYLKRAGLPVLRQPVDDRRYNLLVLPPGREPQMVLIGHVDTIAAHDLDRYAAEVEGDRIRGLGAADMKGGCSAMIEAFAAAFTAADGALPAALALVVGEEEEGDGAQRLIEEHYFPWAVIGEPTDLAPCLGHSGYLEVQVRTRGRRRHASLANRRENAVEIMLHAILEMTRYLEERRPEVVCNIRDMFSARAGFVVPDRCEASLDLHLPPAAPVGEIATDLEEIFTDYCRSHPCGEGDFRMTTIDAGYELPEKGPVPESLQEVFRQRELEWAPRVFRSHSDANQIWAAGIRPILLGPGRLEMAHIPEEAVSFRQVVSAAEIYFALLRQAAAGR